MKVALLSLALLGQPVMIPVSDKVPVLNVERLCKAAVEEDKALGLSEAQSFSGCMEDEKNAQQQVGTIWAASPSAVRNQCETTVTMDADSQSYVDLLTCLQAEYIAARPGMSKAALWESLRGASKDRNKH